MNYFQKNKKNIIIAVVSTLLVASLIAIWLQRKSVNPDDIAAVAFPANLAVGDSMKFEDKTNNAVTKKWDFGDGKTSEKNKGVHFYSKPGFYEVKLTIDNKYTKTFPILVSNRIIEQPLFNENTATIDGPMQAMQLENVIFRAVSSTAKSFHWKFGETGQIDSRDKMAFYSYKKPGNYLVTLITDDAEPITQQIRVMPAYNPIEIVEPAISAPEPDVESDIDDDLKKVIQQIANGNNFNSNYNYLLRSYMCNNDNVAVTVNGQKVKNFYYYCTGLQFDKNNIVQEVKATFDNRQSCIIKLEITQSK
ncbi:PKD domain-containing protein [Chryseobacterium sp. SNU WT5]|uniref:PKD domain-containing protein n=1 Tax=Chryseobacterium sp. SNU WT5 TaxID=2594269 RepID=UPI00117D0B12|nr:PKD domain-containing protein [Chryseobacterium sp. SNU WT5]QDP84776.1 PKD domain-containing protein [Chryseobacterium sp. SNU WT5]